MEEFCANWPMVSAAMDRGQVMTPHSGNCQDAQIMATYAQPSIPSTVDLQNLQNEEALILNNTLNSSNWKSLLPTDSITTLEHPGQYPIVESRATFGWDNLSDPQKYAVAGYQSAGLDPLSTVSFEGRNGSSWQLDSMTIPSTTYGDFPDLSSTSSTFGFLSELTAPNQFSPTLVPGKTSPRKRRHDGNSHSTFSNNLISRKKPKVQPRKAETVALRSNRKSTALLRQQAESLLSQVKQLLDKETSLNSLSTDPDDIVRSEMPFTASFSFSNTTDSACQIKSGSEIPFTPNQPKYDSEDVLATEVDTTHPPTAFKIYQCTFPECHYSSDSQVDWKRHERKEGHWPQERFMCLQCNMPNIDLEGNPMCAFCSLPFSMLGDARTHYLQCMCARERGKTFGRKDHLCKHLEVEHNRRDMVEKTKAWSYAVYSDWPRECGFCGRLFQTWEQRMRHIGTHYQNGLKKSSWKLPFPRPKDHPIIDFESSTGDDSDDGDDNNNDRGLFGNPSGYSSSSSHFPTGDISSNPQHQEESQYHHTYREKQQHHATVDFDPSADGMPEPEPYQTRGLLAFPLGYISSFGKTKAIREYIGKHKHSLTRGVFWLGSKLESGVESSLWNIAFQVALNHQQRDCKALQVLLKLWQRVHQIPRSLCFAMEQQVFRRESPDLTGKCLTVVASPNGALLSQHQHSGRAYHQSVDNTIEFSQSKSPILNTISNCMTQSENYNQVPLPESISSGHKAYEFMNTCPAPSISHVSLPSHYSTDGVSHRRGPWSQAEDAYLERLVHTQGALNWVRIAQLIGSRSPKQCRERYHQNLKPTLNHEPITPEEGLQIERMVGEMGKRWSEIARRLHGRSDNAVKNWWNGSMNRRRRLVLRRRTSSQHANTFDERAQPLSFARPLSRPFNLTPSGFPSRHSPDGPLPSPAVSKASRAESVDGTPSLVSDNSSAFSISPRLASSPGIKLPPLNLFNRDSRRPSLPTLSFRPNNFFSDAEAYDSSSQFSSNTKLYGLAASSPLVSQSEKQLSVSPIEGCDSKSRVHLPRSLPNPVQLPPLRFSFRSERRDESERDSRMHLSSLLG